MAISPDNDKIKRALVQAAGTLRIRPRSPEDAMRELLDEVQNNRVYADGKTFVDLIPKKRLWQIYLEYQLLKKDPDFDLNDFVSRHFYEFGAYKDIHYESDTSRPVREHIRSLWKVLERKNRLDRGSLLALPHPYIVPGGRFSEQFYWDSYFIMLGLAADGHWKMIEGMIDNYTHMIRRFGFIPTANRSYFLSRSQPPFFSHMVKLLAGHKGRRRTLAVYLPYLLLEYRFWMKGSRLLQLREHKAYRRVAQMPNGVLLNRYYDNKNTPRPESHHEDTSTALGAPDREPERLYLHLRAGAESGWDFSSRWLKRDDKLQTIHTADIIPVDLNCLLYQLEQTIAEAYGVVKQPLLAARFTKSAERRAAAITTYCWDESIGFYGDYNFHYGVPMGKLTLAGVFPLYARIASFQQASLVAQRLEKDFLKPGGLVTTLVENGQQWDAPNGWAPLHWIAIQGLRNYGFYKLADEIKYRWIATSKSLYHSSGKLVEKYDVTRQGAGGGGEYPLQDGFGWTNGVLAALLDEDDGSSVTSAG